MIKSITVLAIMLGATILLFAPMFSVNPIRFIYNPSPSTPIGFYRIKAASNLKRGVYIVVPTPPAFREMAANRQYLPLNVPLIKQIFAITGDEICRINESIFVNQKLVALALKYDSKNRSLPIWQGCIILEGNQFFALMNDPNSFDGRYFGALNIGDIIGIAIPIFTWKTDEN